MKILLALPLMLTLAACGGATKGDAKKDDKTVAKPGDAKPADAPKGGSVDLPKLGLKGDVSGEATVSDAIGGGAGHMIQAPGLVVDASIASDSQPKTIEDAKKETEMYDGVKNLKEEKLADGWALTFENMGGMGANYHVNVRRDIDGKAIWCSTMQSTPEQQANALAFCKSLKK
jgi:hypothetical protein